MRYLVIMLGIIHIVGCKNSEKSKFTISQNHYYDSEGSLVTQNWVLNDTGKFGREIRYFKNGQVNNITFYEFGRMIGGQEFYDSLGRLTDMVYWDGLNKSGPLFEFNNNGSLKLFFTYENDFPKGSGYVYDSIGTISRYIYFADYGRAAFIVDYGTDKDSISGSPIIRLESHRESLASDTFEFTLMCATPPDFSKYVKIQRNDRNKVENIETIQMTDEKEFTFPRVLPKFDSIEYQIEVLLISNRTHMSYHYVQAVSK